MMKTSYWFSSLVLAGFVVLAGCSKSDSGTATTVNPAPVEKSFASADPTLKSAADKAVSAIKSADYGSAVAELQKLSANAKLTDDQKKSINDVLAQVQKAIANAGSKAAGEANKALGDVQKSLGK